MENQQLNTQEQFDLVIALGESLLSSGGEIFRVNEIMSIVASKFALQQFHIFTIANGLFVSALIDGSLYSCQVRHISLQPIHLGRVEALCHLSHKIAEGTISPWQAKKLLAQIQNHPNVPNALQIAAAALGSASFAILFGGSCTDGLGALVSGGSLYLFFILLQAWLSSRRVISTILSTGAAAFLCCTLYCLGFGTNLSKMLIGTVFPLVPGVALVTSVRNFMENDYLAGLTRLTDAILTAGCIAVGIGSVLLLMQPLLGEVTL